MEQSGASTTYPVQAGALKHGEYVVIKGFPCKITHWFKSKTGKHGHAKVSLVGVDIFTGKKYEEVLPSTHNIDVPNITRNEYQLMDINEDGYVCILGQDGKNRSDIKLPENELAEEIRQSFDKGEVTVVVLGALNKEEIVSYKIIN